MTVKCWLLPVLWKGEVAAEVLVRPGDIDNLRVAALLKRETGMLGEEVKKKRILPADYYILNSDQTKYSLRNI